MHCLELVTFRLLPGTDHAAFLAAARATEAALRRQTGFISRLLAEGQDGQWTDIVLWTSAETAHAAAASVMADPDFGPFGAAIDMGSARMTHSDLVLQMG